MNIRIKGVAGRLGSRLAEFLIENTDNNVIGLEDLSGGSIEKVREKVEYENTEL